MAEEQDADNRSGVVHVTLCGTVSLATAAGRTTVVRGRQAQSVLAYLVLEGRPVSRDELADVLWADALPGHWQGLLRGVLSKVRACLVAVALPPESLRSHDTTVWLDIPGGVSSDIAQVDSALADGALDDLARIETAQRASSVLARQFLAHDESAWSRGVRVRVAELAADAARQEISGLLGLGRVPDAIRRARARVDVEPLDESAHHLLIEALLADGRRPDALRAFDELRTLLSDELGLTPAPATVALVERLDRRFGPAASRPPLHPHFDGRFVGRRAEGADLRAAWDRVSAQRRPEIVIVQGPAGIGKTRLVSELCDELAATGVQILWGRERAEVDIAYGSIAEALGAAIDADRRLVHALGPDATGLVALFPHLAGHFDWYRPPDDPAVARAHLFRGVAATMAELARTPSLLVLDDLHWTDGDSMALLEWALDGLSAPLLVVATSRPTPTPWAAAMATIQRLVQVSTITLDGLDVEEVGQLLSPTGRARREDLALARSIHARTGGLPLFAAEILRAAQRDGHAIDPESMPSAVAEWVERSVASLPAPLVGDLELASVMGSDVDWALLRLTTHDAEGLVDRCDLLCAHGLLSRGGDDSWLAFAHALTRDAVYDRIPPIRRAELHRSVADAMAARSDPPARSADLAFHYARSGPECQEQAARFARAAGAEALSLGSWEDAATSFEGSLDVARSPVTRARALIGLGRARQRQRRFDEAGSHLRSALAIARADGLPFERAEATLALVGRAGRGLASPRSEQVMQLRGALTALTGVEPSTSSGDARRQVALLSSLERELGVSLMLTDAGDERAAMLTRAVDRARGVVATDPGPLAAALIALRALPPSPTSAREHLGHADEVLDLPWRRLEPHVLVATHCARHEDLLQLGDRAAAVAALHEADELLASYPDPFWRWVIDTWRVVGRMLDGDDAGAERAAVEALAVLPDVPEAQACVAVNMMCLRLLQGRGGEMTASVASAVDRHPEVPCYRAALALCAVQGGDMRVADDEVEWFAKEQFTNLPLDTNRLLGLAMLAEAVSELDRADAAVDLDGLLTPYLGQHALLNCYGGGGAVWGPVSASVARLAQVRGDHERSRVLWERAVAEAADQPLVLERIRGQEPAPTLG